MAFLWAIKERGRIPHNAPVNVALTLLYTWGSLSDNEKHKINYNGFMLVPGKDT